MYDMKPYLQKIDSVIEKGPWKDTWESLSGYRVPGMVPKCEVWHFHSLGYLQCPGVWK